MATITPLIGIWAFPVAFTSAAVAYVASRSPLAVLIAVLATLAMAGVIWGVIRSKAAWRQDLQPTNAFVMAVLIATIGAALLIGGLAGGAVVWAVAGLIIIAVAWLVQRSAPATASR